MERRKGIDMEKRIKRQNEWIKDKMDRIYLVVSKGVKDEWKSKAAAEGKSLNEWIIERVSRD